MARSSRTLAAISLLVALLALLLPAAAVTAAPAQVRFATFNASLNRNTAGQALTDLSTPGNAQADAVAEIIQRVRPDVLLINEFDFEPGNALADAFRANYLAMPHNGAQPIDYPYVFVAPSNTGISSGFDLNNNGQIVTTVGAPGYGDDSFGFGQFPGQFGMAVFSRYPIDESGIRTFQQFLWKDMPGALLPDDPSTPAPADWYSPDELAVFRLSSKSHWDVPDRHRRPTPSTSWSAIPRRPSSTARRIATGPGTATRSGSGPTTSRPARRPRTSTTTTGSTGGLRPNAFFVIAGDQNSDPLDGDSIPGSIQQLIEHPLVNTTVTPSSAGGPFWADVQDALNDVHRSDPAFDTADFCDTPVAPPCSGPGNLRADYVLPRRNLRIVGSGVFWPTATDPLVYLTGTGFPVPSSDHRAVWVDIRVP